MDNKKECISIKYELADGTVLDVVVTLSVAVAIKESDNKHLALIKQDRRHIEYSSMDVLPITSDVDAGTVEGVVERLDDYARLNEAMSRLTKKQHRRVKAHFFYGLSLTEIAKQEKTSIPTVHESIREALKKLKEILELTLKSDL